jgi:glycosyltransferase involved in cell wall biosynthesis
MINITVCILSFNRAAFLSEAIASVLEQTKRPVEIIVFDNGSTDDVYQAVRAFQEKGVRWIGSEKTNSSIWNFKRAVSEAQSEYVFVMHDDDKICPDFLEKQFAFLQANPEVGAVTCNGYIIDETGKRNGRVIRSEFTNKKAELYKCSVDIAIRYASDSCIPFSPVVYRTELARKVNFREEFGIIAFQSDALYECRVHAGQDSTHFPLDLVEKLERFFGTRKSENEQDIILLRKLLIKQHTARTLRMILAARNLRGDLKRLNDEMFSFFAVFKLAVEMLNRKITKYL